MKTTAFVPVEQYLRTFYKPDCDYVDGEVQERAGGERDHSEVWVIDPSTRRDWIHTRDGIREGKGVLQTENPSLQIPLADIFAGIDD